MWSNQMIKAVAVAGAPAAVGMRGPGYEVFGLPAGGADYEHFQDGGFDGRMGLGRQPQAGQVIEPAPLDVDVELLSVGVQYSVLGGIDAGLGQYGLIEFLGTLDAFSASGLSVGFVRQLFRFGNAVFDVQRRGDEGQRPETGVLAQCAVAHGESVL